MKDLIWKIKRTISKWKYKGIYKWIVTAFWIICILAIFTIYKKLDSLISGFRENEIYYSDFVEKDSFPISYSGGDEEEAYKEFIENICFNYREEVGTDYIVGYLSDGAEYYLFKFVVEDFDSDGEKELAIYAESWLDRSNDEVCYGRGYRFFRYNKNSVVIERIGSKISWGDEVEFYNNGVVYDGTYGTYGRVDSDLNFTLEKMENDIEYGSEYVMLISCTFDVNPVPITKEEYEEYYQDLMSGDKLDVAFHDFSMRELKQYYDIDIKKIGFLRTIRQWLFH